MMTAKKPQASKATGRDLGEFRATFDKNYIVPQRIRAAIEQIGKEAWVYEVELQKLAGLSVTDLAMFRDQFEDYFVTVNDRSNKKRLWCGSKEFAVQLREMVG